MFKNKDNVIDSIALGAGCFWCVEAIFEMIKGVKSTSIGYGGGETPDPTYLSVSASPDGHAELTVLQFDNSITTLDAILSVFFAMHNPEKSFVINDKKGELYRSVILYKNEAQKVQIEKFVTKYQNQTCRVVKTEILPLRNFKEADIKYQNYYSSNPNKPFCKNVIGPKIEKLRANGIL
ncbi:MAG: peptide-methionine (S)-S-oxide reductase [Saprospiraceae bacterium]|jgi:peptide-methionine (S)-S-oxide reductase